MRAGGKAAQAVQTVAAVHRMGEMHAVKGRLKMRSHRANALQHAFTNRHTRHNNHKFPPTILAVQFKNRPQIHISFARSRFHFHGKIQAVFADLRFFQAEFLLHFV